MNTLLACLNIPGIKRSCNKTEGNAQKSSEKYEAEEINILKWVGVLWVFLLSMHSNNFTNV